MKTILLFVLIASRILAAPSVTSGTTVYPANPVVGAAAGEVSAYLAVSGPGATSNQAWGGQIVLFARDGVTSFAAMADAAKSANAFGFLIANNAGPWTNNPTLSPNTSTLPAAAVSQADGDAIKRLVGSIVKLSTATPTVPPPVGGVGPPGPQGIQGIQGVQGVAGVAGPAGKDGVNAVGVSVTINVAVGEHVPFTASVTGSAPFTFLWTKDGAGIPGATTAAYVISSASAADAGTYIAQATNSEGLATSNAVILTVGVTPAARPRVVR